MRGQDLRRESSEGPGVGVWSQRGREGRLEGGAGHKTGEVTDQVLGTLASDIQ